MTASPSIANAGPAQAYDGPPDYQAVGRHAVFPETQHDEVARLNFLAHMNRHLSTRVMPFVKTAWERRVEPELVKTSGQPKSRHEVRKALAQDPMFQTWVAGRPN